MWFDRDLDDAQNQAQRDRVQRLESFHVRSHGLLLWCIALSFVGVIVWAMTFTIDEVTRASGEVIASSRVQVIQSVDGGVLSNLLVKEGDRVRVGQTLARLDPTRVGASVGEVEARLIGLKAKVIRLRAEVTGASELTFPDQMREGFRDQLDVEQALFKQRSIGLREDLRTMQVAVDLSHKQLSLVEGLMKSGDVSGSEVLRAKRDFNDAQSRLASRKNKFLEDASQELSKAEDEISQNDQVLARRSQERKDSVFTSQVNGIVKNVRVTTVGGVLRAGEEIMQIVPVDDELIIEAKVKPVDIGHIRPGLTANIRIDPFDYTIFGNVEGKVVYVSADTIKDETRKGEEVYYRVHVIPSTHPITTNTGKVLEVLPGMTAQVDIKTGNRSLMDVLLKPIRKTLSESLHER